MRTLKSLLTIVENDSSKVWRDELDDIQVALNSFGSKATGYSPTELMFSVRAQFLGLVKITLNNDTKLRIDLEAVQTQTAKNIEKAAVADKGRFDKGRATVRPFSLKDFVFLKCSKRKQTKLAPKFKSSYN